jgi:hypothetical protein
MDDGNKINPNHTAARGVLRVVGPALALVGLAFVVIGFGSFFAAFGSHDGPPRYFWCAFVGMPLMGVGLIISKFAFLGRIGRYVAGETAPVAKDAFNYLAEGTQQGVRDVAAAVGEGLRGSLPTARCRACGKTNDTDARFCRDCGAILAANCPGCGHANAPEAKFCDDCGKPLT